MEYAPRLSQACAECKRMKLKCDKHNPCSSCVKRGCASICPQGRMASKGSRYVLANTEQLVWHEQIDLLLARVRQLEGALETIQTNHYNEPHPLLSDELRRIATPSYPAGAETTTQANVKLEELAEGMGTLALDDHGARYFGSTGAVVAFFRAVQDTDGPQVEADSEMLSRALAELPNELSHLAYTFPFRLGDPGMVTTLDVADLSNWIMDKCLPSHPEAWSLFENYWERYAWHFTPFTRSEFIEQILSPIYRRLVEPNQKPLGHRLALLFMVFAIGELMDFTKPFDLVTGLRYYLLARACLCLQPVIESPTLTALQAMHLMNIFASMTRGAIEPEHTWVLSGINMKLALTLGLQHDPSKFGLSDAQVENCQNTLIAVVSGETWQALAMGRPISHSAVHFDWIFDASRWNTEPDRAARTWAARFIRDCTNCVVDIVMSARPVNYGKILQLDKKIREYPPYTTVYDHSVKSPDAGIGELLRVLFLEMVKEVTLLFLHRRCFALAFKDHPEDPLRSTFATSVLACYHSAVIFVTKVAEIKASDPVLLERIWFLWPNVVVSTLIFVSIVARSPGCSLASSAFLELEKAYAVLESTSSHVFGYKIQAKLLELKQKACKAFSEYHATRYDPLSPAPQGVEISEEINALGGGETRIITTRSKSYSSPRHLDDRNSPRNSNHDSPQGTEPSQSPSPPVAKHAAVPDIHTLLQQYASSYSTTYDNSSSYLPTMYPSTSEGFQNPPFLPQVPGSLPNDFGDIFGPLGEQAPAAPTVKPGADILDELGLMGEWQTAVDNIGF